MERSRPVEDYLNEELKDPYFKDLWELELKKLEVIRPVIAYRIKHSLTQKELAKKIGVSKKQIFDIEQGEFSDLVVVNKIL